MVRPAVRILVTGAEGQVGGALRRAAEAAGLTVLPMRRSDLDLTEPERARQVLAAARPDIVVNCAAHTAVDRAEQEPALAFAVNAEGPAVLARWCAEHGRLLIHLSTDYVFAGDGIRPYREDDPEGPVGVYGASKAEGERLVRASGADCIILRTSWVYAAQGKNFVRTMLRLGEEREAVNVVADQHGCPTSAASIANAILAIVDGHAQDTAADLCGTYHYVDRGETTWYDFACRIFDLAERYGRRRPVVNPITTDQYPTPARRPAFSVLDTTRFQRRFGRIPPCWQDSLAQVMAEIFGADFGPLLRPREREPVN